MTKKPVLLVAAHAASWGRASYAAQLARQRARIGKPTVVAVARHSLPLFEGIDAEIHPLPGMGGMPDRVVFDDIVTRSDPSAIVHFDLQGSAKLLLNEAGRPGDLYLGRIPSLSLDVWDTETTGLRQDLADGSEQVIFGGSNAGWLTEAFSRMPRLIPVPIAAPRGAGHRFCAVDSEFDMPRATPRRAGMPITILFSTGGWQASILQGKASGDGADQFARLAFDLVDWLRRGLESLPEAACLIHVGPAPLPIRSSSYQWLPPRNRAQMLALMAAADLVLSANISAATNADALALGKPVCLLNSSGGARAPFWVWPLGFRKFLGPLTAGNPLLDALTLVDVGPDRNPGEQLASALRAPSARAGDYLKMAKDLPTIEVALDQAMEEEREPCAL